ncbi:MAG: hypothetical protein LBE36_12800 [Flavobacteriaceae bacterium]|nr:hypothetical protein [Flavobacteriaceae bacterium]
MEKIEIPVKKSEISAEKSEVEAKEKPGISNGDSQKIGIEKTSAPLGTQKPAGKYNLQQKLNEAEPETPEITEETKVEDLPQNHFSETDLQTEWNLFLENIKTNNKVIYNAISGFKLSKTDENTISVKYPSEIAKAEFEKIQDDFFNHFKRKVNNHAISVQYEMDGNLKVEIVTKRKIFDKMLEINPLLKDLDDLMKFDFS